MNSGSARFSTCGSRANSIREWKGVGSERIVSNKGPGNGSMDNYDISSRVGSKMSPGHISLDRPVKLGSIDIPTQNLDFTFIAEGGDDKYSSSSVSTVWCKWRIFE